MSANYSNLILFGGIFHEFEATSMAVADILKPLGVSSRLESDITAGVAALEHEPVNLVTVNALRWQMLGEKYDPYRDTEAYSPPERVKRGLRKHVEGGGAILGLHTASICFSDWPDWGDLLGGHWTWGASWHPQPESITVTPLTGSLLHGIDPFSVTDELYTDLTVSPGSTVLAHGHSNSVGSAQPVMWSREVGAGRVIYSALGHDAQSLKEPNHRASLQRLVRWALRHEEAA